MFELFSDVCPRTVENFRCLCTGEKGEGRNTFKPLHYLNTPIHRIVKGFIVQGGDFSSGELLKYKNLTVVDPSWPAKVLIVQSIHLHSNVAYYVVETVYVYQPKFSMTDCHRIKGSNL